MSENREGEKNLSDQRRLYTSGVRLFWRVLRFCISTFRLATRCSLAIIVFSAHKRALVAATFAFLQHLQKCPFANFSPR